MSIKRSNAIWEHSKQSGNALVLLLKLADNAADDGYCWPGIEHLAERSRMSTRTVIRITKKLVADGELFVVHNRRHGNKYIVRVGLSDEEFAASIKKHFPFITDFDICQNVISEVTQPRHIRSDIAVSQESSVTVIEPSHVAIATSPPIAEEKEEQQEIEPEGEQLIEQFFGPRPEPQPATLTPHWSTVVGKPWAQWGAQSDEFQRQIARFGDSGRIVQELGYKLEEATGLHPVWGNKQKVKSWSAGLWELYEESGYSIPTAIEAARTLRQSKMTIASPYSLVNQARALAAEKNGIGTREFTV